MDITGIKDVGEVNVESMNSANIPVNIFIKSPDEWCEGDEEDEKDKWILFADNFMPRKQYVFVDAYRLLADTREPLITIVNNKILPLYKNAVDALQSVCVSTRNDLYYWESKEVKA